MTWHLELNDPIDAAVAEAMAPDAVITPDGNAFRQGDRDAGPNGTIRSAQTNMIRLGLDGIGEVDGVYGRNTMNAVQDAQGMFGLPRTGVLDQATQDAFNNLTDDQIAFFTSETEAVAAAEAAPTETEAVTEAEAVTETAEQDEGVADQPTDTPSRNELIDSVFRAEGGYSNDTGDTGNYYNGIFIGTNHGISAPVLAEHLGRIPSVQDMRNLTQDEAREIAATNYYDKYFIELLPAETREIVFHAVYMGGTRGIRAVQNLTGQTPDGQMGPVTRRAMRNATFTPAEFRDEYLRELEFGTEGYSSSAATWNRHGKGWTNRYNALAGD